MTDKVQKIKEWISKEQDGLMDAQGNFEYLEHEGAYHILCNLNAYIDSLQEEPVNKDTAIFKLSRDEVGDCTIILRRHILFIPYWFLLVSTPMHFTECLEFIKAWCCERNIGNAIIYDPTGANKKMVINYRRYKGEKLNTA